MSHRSRLTAVLIDVPPDDFEKTAAFWGAALGGQEQRSEELPEYVVLGHPTPGIEFIGVSREDESFLFDHLRGMAAPDPLRPPRSLAPMLFKSTRAA